MKEKKKGYKRRCLDCAVNFYDFEMDEIVCPSCGHSHKPEDFLELSKLRTEMIKVRTKIGQAEGDEEDTDAGVIEDTDELGDDGDISIEKERPEPEE